MAVPISKLLDLPIINLFSLYIALDYLLFMLLRDSLPMFVKGIRVSQESNDVDVIFFINLKSCMIQLKIIDFDDKQKTFGFKS